MEAAKLPDDNLETWANRFIGGKSEVYNLNR